MRRRRRSSRRLNSSPQQTASNDGYSFGGVLRPEIRLVVQDGPSIHVDAEMFYQEAPRADRPVALVGAPLPRLLPERMVGIVLMDNLLVQFRSRKAAHRSVQES